MVGNHNFAKLNRPNIEWKFYIDSTCTLTEASSFWMFSMEIIFHSGSVP